MTELAGKLNKLENWSKSYNSCVVAFSGGVDSTFLLSALNHFDGIKVRAVTAAPPYVPEWEIEEARIFAASVGIEHVVIPFDIPGNIRSNPNDRCYKCKQGLFLKIIEQASAWGSSLVVDGSNADDKPELRPGMKALRELGVESPLLSCGFTKKDIRALCREWELPVADKPAYSCLLTRVPYNTVIELPVLRRIEKAEVFLHSLGFTSVRVRTHGELARIELEPSLLSEFSHPETMQMVGSRLKELGYRYVALDLNGYHVGNMDSKEIKDGKHEQA